MGLLFCLHSLTFCICSFNVRNNCDWRIPFQVDKFAAFRDRGRREDDRGGGEEGGFKRPSPRWQRGGGGGRGGGRVPDFRKNPDKYTKYSLRDTDLLDNASNSQAAFAFLRELDERKRGEEKGEGDRSPADLQAAKFTFRKPARKRGADKEEEDKEGGGSKGSDGGKKESEKGPPKKAKKSGGGGMMLSHLMDEEEEEEEEDED